MENNKPVIGVLITSYGAIDPATYHNHISCLLNFSKKHQIIVYHINGVQQAVALNMMTDKALEDGCDYLFYLEHDNTLGMSTLDYLLDDNKDIVTGWYTLRRYPFLPIPLIKKEDGLLYRMSYKYKDGATDYLLEAEVGCFGCCLIKSDVIKKLGKDLFTRKINDLSNNYYTPDIILFEEARKAGYKVFVDGRVKSGHVGDSMIVTPDNYELVANFYAQAYPEIVLANNEQVLKNKE